MMLESYLTPVVLRPAVLHLLPWNSIELKWKAARKHASALVDWCTVRVSKNPPRSLTYINLYKSVVSALIMYSHLMLKEVKLHLRDILC